MVEVKLILYDPTEMTAVQSLYGLIMERRMKIQAVMQARAPEAGAPQTHEEKVADAPAGVNAAHGEVLAKLVDGPVPEPESVVTPVTEAVTPASVTPRDIFKQYLDARGFAAARKALDSFGLQRIGDLKPEDAPAFLASLRDV